MPQGSAGCRSHEKGLSNCSLLLGVLQVPEGVDWAAVVKNAMDTYSVELAGGLGPTVGKVWRVGIMVRRKLTFITPFHACFSEFRCSFRCDMMSLCAFLCVVG